MPRIYKNPHGFLIDPPEFRVAQREPIPTVILEEGRCSTEKVGPEVFYDADRVEEAKAVCFECPVRLECLHYAIRNREQFGVWGGVPEGRRTKKFGRAYGAEGQLPRLCRVCREPFVSTRAFGTCSTACMKAEKAAL